MAGWDGHVPFERVDLSQLPKGEQGEALRETAERLQRSLNLQDGPIMRAVLFEMGGGEQRLLWVIHHLAVDGVSWRILLEDLRSLYEQLEQQREPRLAPKSGSFKSWAQQLQEYAGSEALTAQSDYWSSLREGSLGQVPLDHPEGDQSFGTAGVVRMQLSEQQTGQLLQQVPEVYHTQINDVLLTALAQALRDWTGADRHVIALEGHGREELLGGLDLTRTVGWFTSIYPVLLDIEGVGDEGRALKRIKEQLRAVPQRGIGYGVLKYLRGQQGVCALPEPQLLFNYLGQIEQDIADTGLLQLAQEDSGSECSETRRRRHALEINGEVSGGCLSFACTYGRAVHERSTIEAFMEGFARRLRELIAHCLSSEGAYTPSDFPLARLNQGQLDELVRAAGGVLQVEDVYPASPLQQGLLFHSLYAPRSTVYVVSAGWRLSGCLDVPAFEGAWEHLLGRHELLRTGFKGEELEAALQVVHRRVRLPMSKRIGEGWRANSSKSARAVAAGGSGARL